MKTIPQIEEFLLLWKSKAKEFYLKMLAEAERLQKEVTDAYEIYDKNRFLSGSKESREDYEKKSRAARNYRDSSIILDKLLYVSKPKREEKLDTLLDKEVARKRETLITRVIKKVGEIKDASDLKIASNAEINGIIIGELGKVQVSTIYAGGHNIQCLHYRVLLKEVRP